MTRKRENTGTQAARVTALLSPRSQRLLKACFTTLEAQPIGDVRLFDYSRNLLAKHFKLIGPQARGRRRLKGQE